MNNLLYKTNADYRAAYNDGFTDAMAQNNKRLQKINEGLTETIKKLESARAKIK